MASHSLDSVFQQMGGCWEDYASNTPGEEVTKKIITGPFKKKEIQAIGTDLN